MTPLAVRPGRNAAREAKRLKEVRKVKGAIKWHVKERERRQKLMRERWESRQSHIQRSTWELTNIKKVREQALRNVKEDWRLGPLRPNRAIGLAGEKYGALTGQQAQQPEIPVHTWKHRNQVRAKQGLEPEYPLVVDDKKYFHIAKDDRVVVIRGREKGKIGVVQSILARTHEVFITDLNKQYYDAEIFNNAAIDTAKRVSEVPVPIDDVRLVVPYEIVHRKDRGETVEEFKAYNDVIVDNVFMEQHTTGIDPFTGRDYGASEFPKEHRYDPQTGLPIFNRYVAGTKERIAWPDEKKEFEEEEAPQIQKDKVVKPSWIRHPIKRWKAGKAQTTTISTSNETKEVEGLTKAEKEAEKEANELRKSLLEPVRPKSRKAEDQGVYDADTTRNVIEGAESMAYELISPPFPETLKDELRSHLKTRRKDKDDAAPAKKRVQFLTEAGIAAEAKSQGKRDAALKMKTPMQLRWETEQAKKIKQREESPLVSTDDLMAALGKHIEQQRAQKGQKKIAPPRTEELD